MVTIVLFLSRDFILSRIIDQLEGLICDKASTSLLIIVDGDNKLYMRARKEINRLDFAETLVVRVLDNHTVNRSKVFRRKRIADLHNYAKTILKPTDYVLLIEDDGIFPTNGLEKLLRHYKKYPEAGFIEGLQLGRWQSRYIGAWLVDNPSLPNLIQSIEYKPDSLIPIDAGGLYFCLTKYDNYMTHKFYTNSHYGPDIVFGLQLRKQNFINYIDTSVVVDHCSENGKRVFNLENDTPKVITMKKNKDTWRFITSVQKIANG